MLLVRSQHYLCRFTKSMIHSRSITSSTLYVHWPYCRKRCTYCNFNKYISNSVDHDRMKTCLIKEASTLISQSRAQVITSVFFGGGTPSLAEPATFQSLIESVARDNVLSEDAEISMEVNPTAFQAHQLKDFKEAGINRVSIGVQTLKSNGLNILGRDHSVQESLNCLEAASTLFPRKVSLDLIFGWPGQTMDMWIEELKQILHVCDKHLSLYQLTVEKGTQLYSQVQSGKLQVADTGLSEDMYLHAVQFLEQNGFERYEISNFAKEGQYCQHNMSYWNGGEYIGVGPGAHGRFQPNGKYEREARIQTLSPEAWMKEVEIRGHGTRSIVPLSLHERLEELLVVGLRTKWGISHKAWSLLCPNQSLAALTQYTEFQQYFDSGLLEINSSGLRASNEGMNIIDTIIVDSTVPPQQWYCLQHCVHHSRQSLKLSWSAAVFQVDSVLPEPCHIKSVDDLAPQLTAWYDVCDWGP
ncbi:hypothetical protein RRG08_019400 [Elysia crispata]|uniref:Radical S-adenosyl methionine domain-containing protein 1, mitochondrial n=1 Tax=Elysia crispata TaxID=231223 RepID=A0AAE0ZT17_9GAST|nr:hypothetical protein RRG08_019400 [Elysia crispata]